MYIDGSANAVYLEYTGGEPEVLAGASTESARSYLLEPRKTIVYLHCDITYERPSIIAYGDDEEQKVYVSYHLRAHNMHV